jgi:hypothetical protein
MRSLREIEGPFQHGDSLGEVTLAQRPKAHSPIRVDTAVGVIGSLGNPHRFLCGCSPLGEISALSKGKDEDTARAHRGQTMQTEALLEQFAIETRYALLQQLYRLTIGPQAAVEGPQVVLRYDRETDLSAVRGHRQGALTRREGAVWITHQRKMGEQIGRDPPQPVMVAQTLSEHFSVL